jgi:hypothetical protein
MLLLLLLLPHRDVVADAGHDLIEDAAVIGGQLVRPLTHVQPGAPLNIKAALNYLQDNLAKVKQHDAGLGVSVVIVQ